MKTAAIKKNVLLIGIDPKLINFNNYSSGRDAGSVKAAGNDVNEKLNELGFNVFNCIIDSGETAGAQLFKTLSENKFDCIMVGGAVRAIPQYTLLFETVMNLIHQNAPEAKLCFNTGPETTVAAVLRCGL